MIEKTKSQEIKYQGNIITVRFDEIYLPNGKTATREVCKHNSGGVAVLPLDDDMNVTLVDQFRYPYGEILTEIPAGKLDVGEESILECGKRELLEETGLVAEKMIYLGVIYPSPGVLHENIHLYLAMGLTQSEACPDEDEFVEAFKMPFDELCDKILNDEIRDAKTIAAVLKTKVYLEKNK